MLVMLHEADIKRLPYTTPPEVKSIIAGILRSLDENYGADRRIKDDGGCVVYTIDKNDIRWPLGDGINFEINMPTPEYVEVIETSESDYLNALFLTNNEYAVTLIIPKYIAPESLLSEL